MTYLSRLVKSCMPYRFPSEQFYYPGFQTHRLAGNEVSDLFLWWDQQEERSRAEAVYPDVRASRPQRAASRPVLEYLVVIHHRPLTPIWCLGWEAVAFWNWLVFRWLKQRGDNNISEFTAVVSIRLYDFRWPRLALISPQPNSFIRHFLLLIVG